MRINSREGRMFQGATVKLCYAHFRRVNLIEIQMGSPVGISGCAFQWRGNARKG